MTPTGSNPTEQPESNPGDAGGLLLKDFASLCGFVPEAAFLERYPHPFLLQLSKDQATENPGFGTISANMRHLMVHNDLSNCRVFFVTKRATNAFSMMITLGRAENNDLIIRNGKVSKFHAYFSEIDKEWYLTDHNSSNGTYLHTERLKPSVRYAIQDRSELSFTQNLAYRFLLPSSMYQHLLQVTAGQ